MNENKKYYFKRTVEPYSEDATGYLSWSFLGSELLRCANLHASQQGFGYEELINRNLVWVLSRMIFVFNSRPRTNESYQISTWVKGMYKHFVERCFELQSDVHKNLGYVYSVWATIDYKERKVADLKTIFSDSVESMFYSEETFPDLNPARIRLKEQEPDRKVYPGFCELDVNGHVNSMRYLEMLLDTFSLDYHLNHNLKKIDLQFCKESYLGDELLVHKEKKSEQIFQFEIKKGQDTLVRCEMEFNYE